MKTLALTLICFAVAAPVSAGGTVVEAAFNNTKPVAAGGTVVKAAYNAKLKTKILVDGRGLALYMYSGDYKKVSACYTQYHCAKLWPPLLTSGSPKAGAGVKRSLLGVAKRTDGGLQVMYG